jgi:hypothetical protein
MATGDGRFGELRAATYGRGIWEIPLLTAAMPAAPAMTLSPPSLTFAAQAVATASAAQTITVTNTGNATLAVSQIVTTGDFHETDNCAGAAGGVAAGASCAVQITFLPAATGSRAGVLTVYGNVAGGQATAALSGTGAPRGGDCIESHNGYIFRHQCGVVERGPEYYRLQYRRSHGDLQTPAVTGDFAITANTCGATLGASSGCTVSVAFQPTAGGTRTGSLSIADSAGTQTASLSGVGVLPATDALAPLTLSFAAQQLNTASATQQVTLTNAGDAALTLIAAQIASGDFTVVNGCGNSLNGHSSCSLLVGFVPKSVGPGAGVLTVADEYRTQTVALSGMGVAPPGVSLSPVAGMAFAATGVGMSAAAQTVTLTNNGGMALAIQSVTAAGDFAIAAGSNTCGASVAAGAACAVQIVFVPTVAGARAGSLTVVDNAGTSPQSLALSGMGIDFALAANGSTTQTIAGGAQAVYPLLLTSVAGVPGTVAFTCTGAPAYSTCTVSPAAGALGGTATISVTVATDIAAMRWPGERPMMWFAGLLPLGLAGLGRRRVRRMAAMAMMCGVIAMAGCGASRIIPLSTTGGGGSGVQTPDGTYNLTVSGTSAGLTRSVGLTLVVQ